jgi:hypothetical protein
VFALKIGHEISRGSSMLFVMFGLAEGFHARGG